MNQNDEFKKFLDAESFLDTLTSYQSLCQSANVNPEVSGFQAYEYMKTQLHSDEAKKLWPLLDKRAAMEEYSHKGQRVCQNKRVSLRS
jgi:hypothetical protein